MWETRHQRKINKNKTTETNTYIKTKYKYIYIHGKQDYREK